MSGAVGLSRYSLVASATGWAAKPPWTTDSFARDEVGPVVFRTGSVADQVGDHSVVTPIGVVDLDAGRECDGDSAGGSRARPGEGEGAPGARKEVD
jgi:hypothetical protein